MGACACEGKRERERKRDREHYKHAQLLKSTLFLGTHLSIQYSVNAHQCVLVVM